MDMLEYRLKLHRSIVTKFVIVKSNQTWHSRADPSLCMQSLLATGKLEQFNTEVLQVPFSQSERGSNDSWVKELATRRFIGYWISQHYPNATVTLSGVDELFDTEALQKVLQTPELNNLPCFFYPCDFFTMEKRVPWLIPVGIQPLYSTLTRLGFVKSYAFSRRSKSICFCNLSDIEFNNAFTWLAHVVCDGN